MNRSCGGAAADSPCDQENRVGVQKCHRTLTGPVWAKTVKRGKRSCIPPGGKEIKP